MSSYPGSFPISGGNYPGRAERYHGSHRVTSPRAAPTRSSAYQHPPVVSPPRYAANHQHPRALFAATTPDKVGTRQELLICVRAIILIKKGVSLLSTD